MRKRLCLISGSAALVAAIALPGSAPAAGCPTGQLGTPPYCQSIVRKKPLFLTATTKPARDRRAPYVFTTRGRLGVPKSVGNKRGCKGKVLVRFKKGKTTVSARSALLRVVSGRCTYKSRVSFIRARLNKITKRFPVRLRVFVSFGGNQFLKPIAHKVYTVRAG